MHENLDKNACSRSKFDFSSFDKRHAGLCEFSPKPACRINRVITFLTFLLFV